MFASLRPLVLLSLLATPAFAGLPPLAPKELAVEQLADGVYAFVWTKPFDDPIEGNSLAVIGDDGVLVVDAQLFPSSARRVIAELRKLTDKPVRWLVNTHWHDDHTNGNFVFRQEFPGVELIAHRDTRSNLLAHTYAPRAGILDQYRELTGKYAKWYETGLDDEGKELVERRRQRAGEIAALLSTTVDELAPMEEAPPTLTFTDRLVLERGGRRIEVRWLGRGNTAGDTVVFLPAEGIVASGDLLVYPVPFCFGSYYSDWIDTLGKLDALAAPTIVPGHGPLMRDREYLHRVQELLRAIVEQTKAAAAEGLTLEQTKERVTLADWKARFPDQPDGGSRSFDGFVVEPAIERAWRQAMGEDPPEGGR